MQKRWKRRFRPAFGVRSTKYTTHHVTTQIWIKNSFLFTIYNSLPCRDLNPGRQVASHWTNHWGMITAFSKFKQKKLNFIRLILFELNTIACYFCLFVKYFFSHTTEFACHPNISANWKWIIIATIFPATWSNMYQLHMHEIAMLMKHKTNIIQEIMWHCCPHWWGYRGLQRIISI